LSEASLNGLLLWVAQFLGDFLPRFEPFMFFKSLRELGAVMFKVFANLHQVGRPAIAEPLACSGDPLMVGDIWRKASAPRNN
jgi:hypothetical protein